MSTPRKKKSSRIGPQQTNKYSYILGDHLHLVSRKNSNAEENHTNAGHFLAGGRRSSDSLSSELVYLWEDLSTREKDVTVLVCRGFTNDQIALWLKISVSSVKTYLRFVFSKTGVRNKTELRLKFHNFDFDHHV
jgi:DNA-binding NarL/FixJ family response regulator